MSKILKLTERVSCFSFDYKICNFIIHLFFTNVGLVLCSVIGLVLTVCLLISPFGDTIEFFDSDGLLHRNSLLVFS